MSKKVRVRYAPSPTGYSHIGGARTALFNYLFAKHHGGDFIIRIEDTDIERNVEGGTESQIGDLVWLGITPDESPINPGKFGPYSQMERLDIYQKYTDWLLEKGYAYKCYCTPEELEAQREEQLKSGKAPKYNRKCLNETVDQTKPFAIRIKAPENKTYTFNDMVRGQISFESDGIGDWVIVKANGIPTYNYAVVIDDHLMEITNVFRGEEHLSNTPKQLMIYEYLNWEAPVFAHMTLVTNEKHKKLSKRDGSIIQFVDQYRDMGYLPEAIFNFLGLLGWSPIGEEEIFTKQQFIEMFDANRLSKSPSMFDKEKLKWINNQYIKATSLDDVYKLCLPFIEKNFDLSSYDEIWLKSLVKLFHEQISCGQEIIELVRPFFEPFTTIDDEAKEFIKEESIQQTIAFFEKQIETVVEWNEQSIKDCLKTTQKELGVKGKMLYMPIRIASTGIMHGPDLINSILLYGKDKVIKNINTVKNI